MLKNYFKTAIRNFTRNKFYSSINIAGLAIGLATCLLIMLYVTDELNFDTFNSNADRIYRVNNDIKIGNIQLDLAQTPPLLGPEAVKQLPGVEQYTRLRRSGNLLVKKGNINLREDKVVYADSTLLRLFSLKMISGDSENILTDPYTIVVTETIAKKYFNRTDIVGRSLIINDTLNYKITGVIEDVPENSHFNFDFFLAFSESKRSREPEWMSQNFNTYILIKEGVTPEKLEKQLDEMLTTFIIPTLKTGNGISIDEFHNQGNYIKCTLTPLTKIHLYSNRPGEIGVNGSIEYIRMLAMVAVFVLIIAFVNFVNLFTARSSNRAKEVGVRKVLGSVRRNLVYQFIGESFFTVFTALTIAFSIAVFALPYFSLLSGKKLSLDMLFNPAFITIIIAGTTISGFVAGIYPALVLSAFKPVDVLKGKIARGFKGSWLRNSLVVIQFSISILLIIGTIVIYSQLKFIRNKDIGFNRQQVLVIQNSNALKTQAATFKNELLQLSGVDQATMSGYTPVNGYRNSKTFHPSPLPEAKSAIGMQAWFVDEAYIPTLGIKLTAGRNFSNQLSSDSAAIIINEAAVKLLITEDAVNKKLYSSRGQLKIAEYNIIGVVKNFNFSSLREEITPLCLIPGKETGSIAVRLKTGDISNVIAGIKDKWRSYASGQPLNFSFMDDDFNHIYFAEQRTGKIFLSFSVLAIFIACIGLFSLVAYAAEQKIKEIGIRKVLGASITDIISMLSLDFLRPIFIAACISFPLAWWSVNKWLENFASRVSIGWEIYAAGGTAALLIALITIGLQAVKAAIANPVNNLRTE
jgi:putative ABC transport system permease protein